MNRRTILFVIATFAVVDLCLADGAPAAPAARPNIHVVRVPAQSASAMASLELHPVLQLNYDTFVWLEVDEADLAAMAASGADYELRPDPYTLHLGEVVFDPLEGPPPLPAGWDQVRDDVPDLHLVQFRGPTRGNWLTDLEAEGLQVIQYVHPFTYIVWGRTGDVTKAALSTAVRWTGPSAPAFRVLPRWRNLPATLQDVRVLMVRSADTAQVMAGIEALGGRSQDHAILNKVFEVAGFALPGDAFQAAARIPGVYSIQPIPTDGGLRGEMSDQVNVNNVDAGNLAFPGYQAWLTSVGLDGNGVIIANVDGGVQDSHPDLAGRLIACSGVTCGGGAASGHGTHTAGIMAADGSAGTLDGFGFLRGLGVAPGANLVEQLYNPFFTQPNGMLLIMTDSYNNGASLSGNSWGPAGTPQGYDNDTMQVDIGVRDTDPNAPGDQPLTFVLSFMNGYGGVSSQGTPDEAKNLFNIGSTKMQTGSGVQILQIDDLSANTAHGPALDGRTIPHMVAPGCDVDSTYTGSGYALLCGTSMASPHVSGAVALFIQYYRNLAGSPGDPSPAMIKAAFLPAARDLAGHQDADGGTLGHPFDSKQGWGRMDLAAVVDPQVSVLYFDNPLLLNNTGEEWVQTVSALDPTQPLRVMLVWTDAPGHGMGGSTPAWNNDLDLVVETGAATYLGNAFGPTGWSQTGGAADFRNNTEGVFIGPTASGAYTLRVVAANINSDGVPNLGDTTDQDFAVVVYNAVQQADFTVDATPAQQDICAPADAAYTIHVGQILGYTDMVTLSATGTPPGATVGFTPNPVAPGNVSTLTIGNTASATPGTYNIDVLGASTSGTHTATVSLGLSTALPGPFSLAFPLDGATGTAIRPTLFWMVASQATGYDVEIATDAGFTQVVATATSSANSYGVPFDLGYDTLYYWHVRATNACGPGGFTAPHSFTTVPQTLYFTEQFTAADNDLDFLSLLFTPDASQSSYSTCVESIAALPTDPTGGTMLSLSDDSFQLVGLGQNVLLYGVGYSTLYAGSNGYITFTGGDVDFTETLTDHFSVPRISGLFDDLNPAAGGMVSYLQLADRLVVTYQNVPELGTGAGNTFQIEMFFDGRIRLSYLAIAATDGLAGLSAGLGLPADFAEMDLSLIAACVTVPSCPTAPGDLTGDAAVNGGDIQSFVSCYLGGDPFAAGCGCADLDASGDFSPADITTFVDCLLGITCP